MFGYLAAAQAKAEGFTHHGKYYGIPIWIGDPEGDCIVATKFWWMDPLMVLAGCIEGWCHVIRNTEPSFMLYIGEEIGVKP